MKDNIKKLKEQLWKVEIDLVRSGRYIKVAQIKFELLVLYDKEKKMWH